MATKKSVAKEVATVSLAVFTRDQAMASQKYRDSRDVLGVVLADGKAYTAAEIEKLKDEFLHRPVQEKVNGKG